MLTPSEETRLSEGVRLLGQGEQLRKAELLEQAHSRLVAFEADRGEHYGEFIDNIAHDVRETYGEAGEPVVEGDSIDRRIKNAIVHGHICSAKAARARLKTQKTNAGIGYDAKLIREHFKAAKAVHHPALAGSPVHPLIERRLIGEAAACAHVISAESMLADFEAIKVYCGAAFISERAGDIRDHYKLAGQPVVTDSSIDQRIRFAVIHACDVNVQLSDEEREKILKLEEQRGIEDTRIKKFLDEFSALGKLADNRPEPFSGDRLFAYVDRLGARQDLRPAPC